MDANVRGIRISNPDRLVYPELGLTKLDLVRYYDAITGRMLPHVENRPLTLVHCPDGLQAPCNYMRHRRVWGPDVLKRVKIREKTKVGEYLAVVDPAGIVALAQMGIIEIHTWNSTIDTVEKPNRLVWDLDPGPDVTWQAVVDTAIAVRDLLDTLGLQSWVKTTGGHGIHVVAPVTPQRPWDECLAFAKAVAEALTRTNPSLLTTAFPKLGRERKILIDYLRNNRTNTSIAAFSARAREGATVSMPVSWRQVTARLKPKAFTVMTATKTPGADPWRDYFAARQKISAAAMQAITRLRLSA
jgi:bifunctional non-homologous end joining protein LigD